MRKEEWFDGGGGGGAGVAARLRPPFVERGLEIKDEEGGEEKVCV